jgi:hypothetical protein
LLVLKGLQLAPPPHRGRAPRLLPLQARLPVPPRRKLRLQPLPLPLGRRRVLQRQPVSARLAGRLQAALDHQPVLRRYQGKAGLPPLQLDRRLAQQRQSGTGRLAGP